MGVAPLADLTCRPPLNWVGGKGIIREIVRLLFPPWADRYAEHFVGGGSILFGTPPKPGMVEVINDYDSDLVNFYVCVRDRPFALMDELKRLPLQSETEFIQLKRFLSGQEIMPDFSLDELRIARQSLTPEQFEEIAPILQGRAKLWDVRRAAAFYKVNRYCFNGTMDAFAVKPARLTHFIPNILAAAKRLENVVITKCGQGHLYGICRGCVLPTAHRAAKCPTYSIWCAKQILEQKYGGTGPRQRHLHRRERLPSHPVRGGTPSGSLRETCNGRAA